MNAPRRHAAGQEISRKVATLYGFWHLWWAASYLGHDAVHGRSLAQTQGRWCGRSAALFVTRTQRFGELRCRLGGRRDSWRGAFAVTDAALGNTCGNARKLARRPVTGRRSNFARPGAKFEAGRRRTFAALSPGQARISWQARRFQKIEKVWTAIDSYKLRTIF